MLRNLLLLLKTALALRTKLRWRLGSCWAVVYVSFGFFHRLAKMLMQLRSVEGDSDYATVAETVWQCQCGRAMRPSSSCV